MVLWMCYPCLRTPVTHVPSLYSELWEQWDQATQLAFVREQTELPLAKLLIQVYHQQLDAAFREAYARYAAGPAGQRRD